MHAIADLASTRRWDNATTPRRALVGRIESLTTIIRRRPGVLQLYVKCKKQKTTKGSRGGHRPRGEFFFSRQDRLSSTTMILHYTVTLSGVPGGLVGYPRAY